MVVQKGRMSNGVVKRRAHNLTQRSNDEPVHPKGDSDNGSEEYPRQDSASAKRTGPLPQ
jgi:hypothetical protein